MLNEKYRDFKHTISSIIQCTTFVLTHIDCPASINSKFSCLKKITVRTSWMNEATIKHCLLPPKCNSRHSDMPIELSDVLPPQVILTQISECEPYKTILSIISWESMWYLICISFSGSWMDVKLTALCRDEQRPLADKRKRESTSVDKSKKWARIS